jgi:hypothetical protein
MSSNRVFAYNPGAPISGTVQVGSLAISNSLMDYSKSPGGVQWWAGPDGSLGYVIAKDVVSQPAVEGRTAQVSFWRSEEVSTQSFINLVNNFPPRLGQTPFDNAQDAKTWLNDSGYWTSFEE